MVVRSRFRSVLIPLGLYLVAGLLVGYFIMQANQGSRGLDVKRALKLQIEELDVEIAALKATRGDWEKRIALLQAQEVDRDVLDDLARATLGRVHRNDVVIMHIAPPKTP